ncbi:RIP metalloprotease RseP [Rhodospirillum centenum]|uniref:Zinc metalloprotease n=1 Tax=Rhodospirillum centenum (strain ATCC 51521 / SW) TaxID=414684 RepID=B6ISU4_RHOCS|nr:RIP metalloprotease RseP [Rhodospirillum centenum]ACI98615.1 membrane-associated zinc metalloprotease, putative [Rhodospirillum centenum SW]
MDAVGYVWNYGVVFLVVLTVLVFVHELGHYWVARRNGVRVEVFSIGFGPELFGFNDRAGTRWKFSAVPLGGYVKMFGDADAASRPDFRLDDLPPEERARSFYHQSLGSRAAIVAAGPAANFAFAIVALALLFTVYGQPFTAPVIEEVSPDGAAAEAGLLPGDRVLSIDGQTIERFEDITQLVVQYPGRPLALVVQRDGLEVPVTVTPRTVEVEDRFGNTHTIGRIGVLRGADEFKKRDPLSAVWYAGKETLSLTLGTLKAVGQMISGTRGTDELGGPLRIAQMSGEVAQTGFVALVWFVAILSINLGLINLFPIPMLDGGHLLFYGIEAVRGRPLGERAQEYGFRIGLALVLTLMVFATWNDLVHLRVVQFFVDVLS